MDREQLLHRIILEGHTLTRNEREKAQGPYDAIYLHEKIRYHSRQVMLMRGVLLLVVATLGLALYLVLNYNTLALESAVSLQWLKGLFVVLVVLCLLGLLSFLRNHAKNASLLRIVDYLQRDEGASSEDPSVASGAGEVVER